MMHFSRMLGGCCTLLLSLFLTNTIFAQEGNVCETPIVISDLPYNGSGNTSEYGNDYGWWDIPEIAPNAITNGAGGAISSSYIGGNDVVYAYTPTASQVINISTTNDNNSIGLWAFTGCPFGSTLGYHTSHSGISRAINGLSVLSGVTYYIVISTWSPPASTAYTIHIEEGTSECPELGLNIGSQCNDGNSNTINDTVNENCECVGVVPPTGWACEAPIQISSLPYVTTDNTENYYDNYGPSDFPALAEGAIGDPSDFYLNGDDVVYAYTSADDGYIDVTVTENIEWTGVFVFTGCPFQSTVGGHTDVSEDLKVEHLPVQSGVTYYIVISTYADPQSTPYTLNVVEYVFDCQDLGANIGDSCDDGDSGTYDDTLDANCNCVGTPYDCYELEADFGDPCIMTTLETGVLNENCDCVEITCLNIYRRPSLPVFVNADGSLYVDDCQYWQEYSEVTYITNGYEYEFTSVKFGVTVGYITVREGSVGGEIIGKGYSPLTITATSNNNLFVHWTVDEDCYTESGCTRTTIACLTCATLPDCEGVIAGPNQSGTPCDDGDPDTVIDIYNENCECEGVLPHAGMVCEDPIEITSLPYTTTDHTNNYDNNYGSSDLPVLAEDANGAPSSNYLNGDDVVYAYTPSSDGNINIKVIGNYAFSGVFIFTGCPFESTVGGCTETLVYDSLSVEQLAVQSGVTYYIVISTSPSPQSTPYTLNVTEFGFDCPELEANIGDECILEGSEEIGLINDDCECVVPTSTPNRSGFNFTMYPNPADHSGSLTLSSKQSIDRYEVIDITGKVIDTKTISNQNEIKIALRDYGAGIYILKAYSGSDFSTQKMIVR